MSKTSKKAKVLSALESGQKVTRKLAASRFKVVNLRATIADLRNNGGYNILTNYNNSGEVVYTMTKK
jgi:biotin operon repressor